MNRKDVFQYMLHQLLDRYKEKALKEIEISKNDPDMIDNEWALEDVCASDFTNAMERLGVCDFTEKKGEL